MTPVPSTLSPVSTAQTYLHSFLFSRELEMQTAKGSVCVLCTTQVPCTDNSNNLARTLSHALFTVNHLQRADWVLKYIV